MTADFMVSDLDMATGTNPFHWQNLDENVASALVQNERFTSCLNVGDSDEAGL